MSEQPTHAMLVRADDGLHLLPVCTSRECAERTITFAEGAQVVGVTYLYPEPIPGVQFWSAVQLGKAPKTAAAVDKEVAGRDLYERETDNNATVHCNRFPVWNELSAERRAEYCKRAGLVTDQMVELAYNAADRYVDSRGGHIEVLDDGELSDMLRSAITAALEAQP